MIPGAHICGGQAAEGVQYHDGRAMMAKFQGTLVMFCSEAIGGEKRDPGPHSLVTLAHKQLIAPTR